jgi:hypothetical protein
MGGFGCPASFRSISEKPRSYHRLQLIEGSLAVVQKTEGILTTHALTSMLKFYVSLDLGFPKHVKCMFELVHHARLYKYSLLS